MRGEPLDQTAYLAPRAALAELVDELGDVTDVLAERLVLAPGPPRRVVWAQDVWLEPHAIAIRSIADGARALRDIQRNWHLFDVGRHVRRAHLIAERLPHVSAKPLVFPTPPPSAPLGAWTLADRDRLVASPRCLAPVPDGRVVFEENRVDPPSRAYLKLWEALTRWGERPGPGDRCLDLGSSPGGWTWALADLGADVVSVDKAPLDPRVAAHPRVEALRASAFGLDPAELAADRPFDWLVCDVVCYPDRLADLVSRWLEAGAARRFVCTIKLQGDTDAEAIARLTAIPGSRAVHLWHNRHEVTWLHDMAGPVPGW